MKAHRQNQIKRIIESRIIDTQEELASALRNMGIDVTQATVSRDIKEMRLVKIPYGNGSYRYAFPSDTQDLHSEDRMHRLFKELVKNVNFSENIVVISTQTGAAGTVCLALDNAKWPEIIGTVAGDDTIIAVIKQKVLAEEVALRLETLCQR